MVPDRLPSLTDPVPLHEWQVVEKWLQNDFFPIAIEIGLPALTDYLEDHAMAPDISVLNALGLKSLLDIVAEVSHQRNNVPAQDLLYSLANIVDGLWEYGGDADQRITRFAKLAEYIEDRLWQEEYGETMVGAERIPSADHAEGKEAKKLITRFFSVFRKSDSEPALQLFAKYRAMSRQSRTRW
ncbi:hypothetical protein NliqN6_2729 [Naganishia liquefaciens]|uniref:Uncharacterized protein n=1 Tax=Naganishia liquefaciens TaxID=104408 RepID=A0A8H3TSD6_9TREE|nr:hypothetical protein NliqN6_2729 [Naganishia liquefaciens]